MSQRTESPEFAPGFIWQLVLVTVAVLCFVAVTRGLIPVHLANWPGVEFPITLYPWVHAGGQTIANGLQAFSGLSPEPPPAALRASSLALLLITMVLCPTAFFFEWRRRRLTQTSSAVRPPLKIFRNLYALCGMVTIIAAAGLVPAAYFSETVRTSLRRAQAIQTNRDLMVNDLNMLASDATQYYLFPKQIGGGGRSFEGYSIPQNYIKTDEGSYSVSTFRTAAAFRATSVKYPSCIIEVKVDTLGRLVEWSYKGEFQ